MHPILGNIDLEQIKLPLGFIRVVELILSIIAYVALNGWRFEVSIFCPKLLEGKPTYSYEFSGWSFDSFVLKNCNGTEANIFDESFTFTTGFVKFLSVVSIMYCLAILFVYLYRWNAYTADENIPRVDTGITILIAALWFVTFWTFWRQVSNLEAYSTPEHVQKLNNEAKFCLKADNCEMKSYAMYATMSVSVLASLGCAVLFAYNIWLTYKETIWFRQRQMNQVPHTVETHTLG